MNCKSTIFFSDDQKLTIEYFIEKGTIVGDLMDYIFDAVLAQMNEEVDLDVTNREKEILIEYSFGTDQTITVPIDTTNIPKDVSNEKLVVEHGFSILKNMLRGSTIKTQVGGPFN
jgi:sensor histidine kinase regulating citrate/malate metabolism